MKVESNYFLFIFSVFGSPKVDGKVDPPPDGRILHFGPILQRLKNISPILARSDGSRLLDRVERVARARGPLY